MEPLQAAPSTLEASSATAFSKVTGGVSRTQTESTSNVLSQALSGRPMSEGRATTAWSQRTSSLLGVQIVSTGSYVPDQIVTNSDLQNLYGCDPGWIEQRTGILRRRYAASDQATSDLCIEAAKRAIFLAISTLSRLILS